MLEKVISGGQTGADIAGLKAAKLLGYKTGGYAPKNYKTLDGPNYELKTEFGLEEIESSYYPERTERNAKESDGTIRIASDFFTAGEKCTLKFIRKHKKPYFDIDVDEPFDPSEAVSWIKDNNIKVLNIAGNSERTTPGIEEKAITRLHKVFFMLKHEDYNLIQGKTNA